MENVSLSIKEEKADDTKYGSSTLDHDIGVLEEASGKVNMRQIRSISFQILICCKFCHFTIFLQIHEVSCQLFIKEEAEEAKHNVPGNFPSVKEELLLER